MVGEKVGNASRKTTSTKHITLQC